MKKYIFLSIYFTLALFLGACWGSSQPTITDAWVRPAAQGGNSAVYFVIENHTSADVVILSADTDVAESAEIHMSMISDDGEGIMHMKPQNKVTVSASDSVHFEPGGLHIMLVGLNKELLEGEQIDLSLLFEDGTTLDIHAQVEQR